MANVAHILARSSRRGLVLFPVALKQQLSAAYRNRQGGLSDYQEWEGNNGETCWYYEDAGLSDYWQYSCGGEFYEGGGGAWEGRDASGNPWSYDPNAVQGDVDPARYPRGGGSGGGFPAGGAIFDPSWVPDLPEPLDIDFPIGSYVPPRCPAGQYPSGETDASGQPVVRCRPYPSNATPAQKKALDQQGQKAIQSAQRAQNQLKQMAEQCAAKGGRLVKTAGGKILCQLPNGKLEDLSGWPWWVWLLIGGGAIAILK